MGKENKYNVMDTPTYRVLDLFAGIGGASYAGKLIGNWRTVCYVEWDDYCRRVIQARIRDGIFDDAPIWDDVQTFDGKPWRGSVDIVTGGFPCQGFSVAGKQLREEDERNMWPDTLRVIGEVRPRFAFLENVPALITSGYFGRIIGDLSEIGYDCRWTVISAADVGAPHTRKRLWILCWNTNGIRFFGDKIQKKLLPKTNLWERSGFIKLLASEKSRYKTDPEHNKISYGISDWSEQLSGYGNAWVPVVAAYAWNMLSRGLIDA